MSVFVFFTNWLYYFLNVIFGWCFILFDFQGEKNNLIVAFVSICPQAWPSSVVKILTPAMWQPSVTLSASWEFFDKIFVRKCWFLETETFPGNILVLSELSQGRFLRSRMECGRTPRFKSLLCLNWNQVTFTVTATAVWKEIFLVRCHLKCLYPEGNRNKEEDLIVIFICFLLTYTILVYSYQVANLLTFTHLEKGQLWNCCRTVAGWCQSLCF